MAENWKNVQISCHGGLITASDALELGEVNPGAAVTLINYEPHPAGGYRRVQGFSKYDAAVVPGTGEILGCAVLGLAGTVLACRGTDVYTSAGSGWTKINGANVRSSAAYTRVSRFGFMGNERYVLCNGADLPHSYNPASSTYTVLTSAPAAATCAVEFAGRNFFGKDNLLTFSATFAENDFTPANGAGQVNVGAPITGLALWRDALIVFCTNRIFRFTGTSTTDFALAPVSANLGCPWPETICELNGDLIFLSHDGLRNIAGSPNFYDTQLTSISKAIQKEVTDLPRAYNRVLACTVRKKTQYRLLANSTATPAGATFGLIASLRSQASAAQAGAQGADASGAGWEFAQLKGLKATCADSWSIPSGERELAIFGNDSGYIYRQESGNSFDGAIILATYQTPALTFGDVNVRKVFRKLEAFLDSEGSVSLKVALILDQSLNNVLQPLAEDISAGGNLTYLFGYPTATFGAATFGTANVPRLDTNLIGSGFQGAFRFTTDAACPPFSIKTLACQLSLGGRK
jgi:hypothetical protein